jgi:anti-sigma B factor antagonist
VDVQGPAVEGALMSTAAAALRIEEDREVVVVRISGELDLSNVRELQRDILERVENTAVGVVVDLSEITYLDSAGIQLLGDLAQRLEWRGQRLAVASAGDSRAGRVLAMAGADALFPLEPAVDAARERVVSHDQP